MKKLLFALLIYCTAVSFGQEQDKDQGSQESQQTLKISSPQLIQPIIVTIGGNFFITGSFNASAAERVDALVSRLIALAPSQTATNIYPLREIKLIRRNGEQIKIDLLKFRFTGDFKNNPYLMNDD